MDRLLRSLRELQPSAAAGAVGAVGAAIGFVLVAVGIALEEQGAGVGAAVRPLGGVLLLGGLGLVLFWESRRRNAAIGSALRIGKRYRAATVHWRWPDRAGVAAVAIGLGLLAPALVVQVLFGTIFGVIVIAPGIMVFWGGVALVIYARFQRTATGRKPPGEGGSPR